ncbi:MAG: hypothetical protein GQ574_23930 [Crocinitomix sp.]|nr:hypothetical protein [Crocinitomix sp.]
MKKITIVLTVLLFALSACDSSAGFSFYMTNNGEEVTQVTCGMSNSDLKVRVDVSKLQGHTGGDLLVRFEMVSDEGVVTGEGTGELYVNAADIPEDKMLWIDMNPTTSKIKNFETLKPFDIFYFCVDDSDFTQSKIRITYYEPSDAGEEKVGYQDEIVVLHI